MKNTVLISIALLLWGCNNYPTKAPLLEVTEKYDPSARVLSEGFNNYVHRTHLEDGTEIGKIDMKDASSSKYWFRSHHFVDDIGGTWFKMSDGTTSYMAGLFCCEVQLPDQQLESLDELKEFIKNHHGIGP